jgi:chromosome segregation ATPase
MSVQTLQRDIEEQLDEIDPIGGKIRKLTKRVHYLETKKQITAREYKEITSGWLMLKELEQQRKQFHSLESSLDSKFGRLLKVSKQYDKLAEKYAGGQVDPAIYAMTLRKLYAKLQPKPIVNRVVSVRPAVPITTGLFHAFENLIGAVLLLVIVIPALYSCSSSG